MMRRAIAGIAGGAVLFLWSFLSWVVLPIHSRTIQQLPQEDTVMSMMRSNMPSAGVYYFPWLDAAGQKDPAAMAAWTEKYSHGPIGFIVYTPNGGVPFDSGALIVSFIIGIMAVRVAIWLYQRSMATTSSYLSQISFFGTIGVMLIVAVYLQEWIHMKYPLQYTLAFCTDALAGWVLVGLVVPPILRGGTRNKDATNE